MKRDAHILIVDDDERIRTLLHKFLIINGFLVSSAHDSAHARRLLAGLSFDLVVLDVMMPGEDGISLIRDVRSRISTPFFLLTARGETESRIEGLEAGADDYLSKPFEPKELLLRINAILRRVPTQNPEKDNLLKMGAFRYDKDRGELWQDDKLIRLTATESQLMRLFSCRPGEPFSRALLVEELGRSGGHAQERAIDVQITRLRRKIEANPKQPRYLQTVRKQGYMLAPD